MNQSDNITVVTKHPYFCKGSVIFWRLFWKRRAWISWVSTFGGSSPCIPKICLSWRVKAMPLDRKNAEREEDIGFWKKKRTSSCPKPLWCAVLRSVLWTHSMLQQISCVYIYESMSEETRFKSLRSEAEKEADWAGRRGFLAESCWCSFSLHLSPILTSSQKQKKRVWKLLTWTVSVLWECKERNPNISWSSSPWR